MAGIEPTMARWPWTHTAEEKAYERKGVPYLTYATSAASSQQRSPLQEENSNEERTTLEKQVSKVPWH